MNCKPVTSTPVEKATSHVLALPRVTLHHLQQLVDVKNIFEDIAGSPWTWLAGSKQALVISGTVSDSWKAFSDPITGAYVTNGKWILCQSLNVKTFCSLAPWVGHQVGLELRQVDVERPVEAEGGGDGGDHLAQDDHFITSDRRSLSI